MTKALITQELIDSLIVEYSENLYDYWDIAAKIINKIYPREQCFNDSEFYYHVFAIWSMIDNYRKREPQL